MKITSFIFLIFLCIQNLWAFEVPPFVPNVVDQSGALNPKQIEILNRTIEKVRNKSGAMASVLIVNTLNGEPIENAAVQTFKAWQLGERGVDNGLLIFVAIRDRQVRIEVGYGLEGSIPDLKAAQVIEYIIAPEFRKGNYLNGLTGALTTLDEMVLMGDRFIVKPPPWYKSYHLNEAYLWLAFIFFCPFIFRVLAVLKGLSLKSNLQPTASEKSLKNLLIGPSLSTSVFLAINPGVFFVFRESIHPRLPVPELVFTALLFFVALIWLHEINKGYASMFFTRYRPARINYKSPNALAIHVNVFGRGYSTSGASGSQSSGGSISSSSGGGRSGGGGASGRW